MINNKFFKCIKVEYFKGSDYDTYINEYIMTLDYMCVYLDKFIYPNREQPYYIPIYKSILTIYCPSLQNYIKLKSPIFRNIREGDGIYITEDLTDFSNKELWGNYLANEPINDTRKVDLITSQL